MANTKKQDKPNPVPAQAVAAPADLSLNSVPSESDTSGADAAAGGVAVIVPGAEPVANTVQEAGSPASEDAAGAGASLSQPGQADDALHGATDAAGLEESTSSASVELNPATVEVYPLRSFMDEGELRRRHGPGYLVPRRHAEELELRKLVSRTPLEE